MRPQADPSAPDAPVPGAGAAATPGAVADAVFPPTLREVMLRPYWLGMLALCLLVAGIFAWLGQWQLSNAIDTDPPPPGVTEDVRPLADVVAPGEYLPEPYVGQRVEVSGEWVQGDFLVVASRFNDGVEGYWVTGQLRVAPRTSLAVAVGWAPDEASADAAAVALNAEASDAALVGRLVSDEGPQPPPRTDPMRISRMSPAALLNRWHDVEALAVYRPFLVAETAPEGLAPISAAPPTALSPINWLNVFYAIEWVIFAGFAFYIWYRLTRDRWEREVEEYEDAAA